MRSIAKEGFYANEDKERIALLLSSFPELTRNIFNDLGGEENGLYLCKATNNTGSGNDHPCIAGQNKIADEITAFVMEKGILN